ncbi:hypothetical protein OSB04_030360 [Centaurea solstitialis]|uniref:SP-RING-type domain-containing protein n=1 Tax=Centaurea solstitialis TaxID=347529 RepID=A0AA38SQY4_9ASTR|nr:hypothetical protein OSB04_030360 [Centaurea solstitialis]
MASTSAPRSDTGSSSRMKSAASNLSNDNQTLLADIRKALGTMKEIGVSLEKQHKSQMVKELEAEFMELLKAYEDCVNLSSAVDSVGNMYQPTEQVTDFKKLLDGEMANAKRQSSSAPQANRLLRQFREAIWNVHNSGQPMPGEEQEDIVMTSTQSILLNITCPLSGKPVGQLSEPVRSMDCKHIYEKKVIMEYIRAKNGQAKCPMAGTKQSIIIIIYIYIYIYIYIGVSKKIVQQEWSVIPCYALKLRILRNERANCQANVIEDFTEDLEEEDSD